MAEIIPFQPTATQPFQFSPTLDGVTYTATIPWNLTRQDFFLSLATQSGVLVCYRALVGSPPTYDIDLLAMLGFSSTLVYRESSQNFEIGP